MNQETLAKANELNEEINILRDNIHFFAPMDKRHDRYNEDKIEIAKHRKRQFLFFGYKDNDTDKNYAKLNFYGFFGGKEIEVDNEFVTMCHDYFVNKYENKLKELEELK